MATPRFRGKTYRFSRPTTPLLVRVFVLPVKYFNFHFTDEKKWACYALRSPNGEQILYGYVERYSVDHSRLDNFEDTGSEQAFLLRVRYPEERGGDNQVIIDQVVDAGWIEGKEPHRTAAKQGSQ